MSTGDDSTEMEKINVRVPENLLDQINDIWEERGYPNKSEFIRDALRDAVNPPRRLSSETLDHIAEAEEDVEDAKFIPHDVIKQRRGVYGESYEDEDEVDLLEELNKDA